MRRTALAIHGGAGTIDRSSMTPELEKEYRRGLEEALRTGWSVLEKRGCSLDAVEASVASLEDCPLFNAGRGSVFTHEGKNEMDACIMDGKTLDAGAVAFIRNVRNPVRLARLVMERTEHVFLGGDGAMSFAEDMGAELADNSYFFTDLRWQQLEKAIAEDRIQLDHVGSSINESLGGTRSLGTVGAVACDTNGDVAAATSTGGMTNKKFGRIGDTPVIGAGTYADNSTCAVSCTGHGEFFILGVAAYDVAARMKYKGVNLEQAAQETIERLTEIKGEGGLIAVDAYGNVSMPMNSDGMYRGTVTADGGFAVDIYR